MPASRRYRPRFKEIMPADELDLNELEDLPEDSDGFDLEEQELPEAEFPGEGDEIEEFDFSADEDEDLDVLGGEDDAADAEADSGLGLEGFEAALSEHEAAEAEAEEASVEDEDEDLGLSDLAAEPALESDADLDGLSGLDDLPGEEALEFDIDGEDDDLQSGQASATPLRASSASAEDEDSGLADLPDEIGDEDSGLADLPEDAGEMDLGEDLEDLSESVDDLPEPEDSGEEISLDLPEDELSEEAPEPSETELAGTPSDEIVEEEAPVDSSLDDELYQNMAAPDEEFLEESQDEILDADDSVEPEEPGEFAPEEESLIELEEEVPEEEPIPVELPELSEESEPSLEMGESSSELEPEAASLEEEPESFEDVVGDPPELEDPASLEEVDLGAEVESTDELEDLDVLENPPELLDSEDDLSEELDPLEAEVPVEEPEPLESPEEADDPQEVSVGLEESAPPTPAEPPANLGLAAADVVAVAGMAVTARNTNPQLETLNFSAASSNPTYAPVENETMATPNTPAASGSEVLLNFQHEIVVEVARTKLTGEEITQITYGSVIELDKLAGEPVELVLDGKTIAHAEVVLINKERLGVRIIGIMQD